VSSEFLSRAQQLHDRIVAWRREMHMYPEPGFQEHRTAQLVAETLRRLGLEVETGVGRTGVVGRMGGGRPAVGIRADMDALRLQEDNDLPYASRTPGMMHACGHDAHTAMLLGAAELLRSMPDRPAGEIRFLFQPCEEAWDEEGKGGAVRMIEDGALADLDAIIGLHIDTAADAGHIGIRSGYAMAAVDPFDAVIIGSGCHSSAPHQGLNPIFLLTQVAGAIMSIPTVRISPLQPAIVSMEAVHAGGMTGVIPEKVTLHGNIRCYDEGTRLRLRQELERALGLARALGGDYQLTVRHMYPATYNNPEVCAVIRQVAEEMVGAERVYVPEQEMAGEDFGYMSRRTPGVLFRLGATIAGETRPLHSPTFDLDESALPLGSAMLAQTACRLLDK